MKESDDRCLAKPATAKMTDELLEFSILRAPITGILISNVGIRKVMFDVTKDLLEFG